jgi:hypothetical protein
MISTATDLGSRNPSGSPNARHSTEMVPFAEYLTVSEGKFEFNISDGAHTGIRSQIGHYGLDLFRVSDDHFRTRDFEIEPELSSMSLVPVYMNSLFDCTVQVEWFIE